MDTNEKKTGMTRAQVWLISIPLAIIFGMVGEAVMSTMDTTQQAIYTLCVLTIGFNVFYATWKAVKEVQAARENTVES